MKVRPETILAEIPGWEGAEFERLTGGLMNVSYLVRSGDSRAVLKIDSPESRAPRNPRDVEARLQSIASEAGLAGAVLYHDDRCYLSEYIEGATWTQRDLRMSRKLTELGSVLRRLHALPPAPQIFDPVSAAARYAEKATAASADVERHMATIREIGLPSRLAFCHNDLVAENIVGSPDIRFIDWEYACSNDPMFDVATLIAHHKLGNGETDTLMRAYCGGDWQEMRPVIETQVDLYESLLWLWQEAGES